jgi:hypothetical protein
MPPGGSLFVPDHSVLPRPTHDLGRAREDILTFGYCACPCLPLDRHDATRVRD